MSFVCIYGVYVLCESTCVYLKLPIWSFYAVLLSQHSNSSNKPVVAHTDTHTHEHILI